MNTKTTKFLAVLAVFAMAFAAFAVITETPSEDAAATAVSGIWKDKEMTDAVTVNDLTDPTGPWYVEATASITGDITIAKTLVIGLADGVTSSDFTVDDVTINAAVTIGAGVTMKINSDKVMTIAAVLTIDGTLENNAYDTTSDGAGIDGKGLIINGDNAKITGNGKICGTSPRLVKVVNGTLEKITISQNDWAAGIGDNAASGNDQPIIYVQPATGKEVKISGITVLMKDTGKKTATETYGTHGIGVYGTETGYAGSVTIENVTFSTIGSGTIEAEFLILDMNTQADTVLKIKGITRDPDVRVKDGYGEFTVEGVATLGTKVTLEDGSIKSLRVSKTNTVAGDFSVNSIIFKSERDNILNVTSGTLTVNGDIVDGTPATGTTKSKIVITDGATVANNGTTRVEGKVSIEPVATNGSGLFKNTGTLVIDDGAAIINLTNTKTVRLYDGVIGATEAATGTLENNGTIYVMDEAAVINVATKSGTGTIDTSAISEEVFIHGDISTSGTEFKWNQKVTFDGDTTLLKGASLIFYGKVIIPAGVTVTIEDGAAITINGNETKALGQLNIDGTLIIEGSIWTANAVTTAGLTIIKGEVVNNGTIELAYDGDLEDNATTAKLVDIGAGTTFVNNGIITIGEKSKLTNAAKSFVNSADGVITIYGDLDGTTATNAAIQNSGLITLSSEVNSAITISNAAVGAEIDILMTNAAVTINDAAIKDDTEKKLVNGGNIIVLTPTNVTCGGITVTSATFKVTKTENDKSVVYTYTSLEIEGSLIVSKETGDINPDTDYAALALTSTKGRIVVADELALANTNLTTAAGSELYVSGELTLTKDCTFDNDGILTVPGIAYLIGCSLDSIGTVNAAMYKIPQTVLTSQVIVYTNVPDAIAGAEEASVKTVTVTGTVTIAESIVIPAGMTVKVSGDTSKVTIAKDVVVEVYSDGTEFAVLNNEGTIKVNGKLIYDDAKKSQKGTEPVSEVIVKSGNMVVYTTLAWAIADAGSEEATITLCGDTTITKDMTIPENITVDTNDQDFTVEDCVLTIDGYLYLNGTTVYDVTDDAEIIVNGAIISEKEMPFDGKKFPAGLYFSVGDKKLNYIGNIDDAEAWALVADDDKLAYEGDLKTIGISFDADATLDFNGNVTAVSMTVGSNAIVNFNKNVEIATVTMGEATINFTQGKTIDGIFTSPVGTIAFDGALVNAASSLKVAVKDTVTTMTLSGDIGKAETEDDYEYQVSALGDVVITAKLADLYVGAGTTTIGKSVSIDYILVDGDLVIDNDYKLTAKDGYVYGSITANDATDTKKKATVEFSGYLYVGIDFDEDAVVASAAAVAGDVTAKYAFVSADATVSDTITDMLYSTDVYVEGVEELTIYSNDSKYNYYLDLSEIAFVISDPSADPLGWFDEDGKKVTSYDIGAYDAIYALFDYNVYNVKIITDAGVKSVAINGVELENTSGNVFMAYKLAAGTFKVTYTLKNGYSGEAVLSTSTGTILKDNSFVISPGSDCTDFITFQLAGTEPTPEPEPVTPEEKSEWTVTTILLVILVILIAIMAVIVALRLNRS